jgi:hypothetical protein
VQSPLQSETQALEDVVSGRARSARPGALREYKTCEKFKFRGLCRGYYRTYGTAAQTFEQSYNILSAQQFWHCVACAAMVAAREPLFLPFRALGYITDRLPFAVQRLGRETYVTVSVGKAWQVHVTYTLHLH